MVIEVLHTLEKVLSLFEQCIDFIFAGWKNTFYPALTDLFCYFNYLFIFFIFFFIGEIKHPRYLSILIICPYNLEKLNSVRERAHTYRFPIIALTCGQLLSFLL